MSNDPTPEWSEPQINWYREYLLNPDANAKISFDNASKKQEFENSLYKKIWGKTLGTHKETDPDTGNEIDVPDNYPAEATEGEDAGKGPEPYYTFTYGVNDINAEKKGCQKAMIFGITFCHVRSDPAEGQTTYGDYIIHSGYLFIIAAYTQGEGDSASNKVIVRTHQMVPIPNTEFCDGASSTVDGAPVYHGIRVTEGEIVFGIEIIGNPTEGATFYFPRKSFFLEGRHQDPVPFIDGYDGSFTLTI